jgi:hypothetical protein
MSGVLPMCEALLYPVRSSLAQYGVKLCLSARESIFGIYHQTTWRDSLVTVEVVALFMTSQSIQPGTKSIALGDAFRSLLNFLSDQ